LAITISILLVTVLGVARIAGGGDASPGPDAGPAGEQIMEAQPTPSVDPPRVDPPRVDRPRADRPRVERPSPSRVRGATEPDATARPRPVPETAVALSAAGTFTAAGTGRGSSEATGRVVRYRVLVEDGLRLGGRLLDAGDAEQVADVVHGVLDHRRGWQRLLGVRFVQVPGDWNAQRDDPVQMTVHVASPRTVDARCYPLLTFSRVSCAQGSAVYLNARRWFAGADTYGDDLVGYRRYLVAHEAGHVLGFGHVGCPRPGARAPIMVQQTKSLDGCVAWPWPAGAGAWAG
jgi:hypothetical protein